MVELWSRLVALLVDGFLESLSHGEPSVFFDHFLIAFETHPRIAHITSTERANSRHIRTAARMAGPRMSRHMVSPTVELHVLVHIYGSKSRRLPKNRRDVQTVSRR
jgi:hypothetical protein